MNSWLIEIPTIVSWLLHVAVCVTFVSVAGGVALWACKSLSAPLRHTLALGILVSVVLLPACTAAYQWNLVPRQSWNPTRVASAASPALPSAAESINPLILSPDSQGTSPQRSVSWRFIFSCTAVTIWIGGSLFLFARMVSGLRRQRAFLQATRSATDQDALELFTPIVDRLGIRRNVVLRTSEHTPWPFTIGLFRPQVIVPERLLREASKRQLEAVLNHELAHVYRLDYGVLMIQQAVAILYWWNPGFTQIKQTLEATREQICDDFVLSHFGEGKTLAGYLVHYLEKAACEQFSWGVGMTTNEPGTVQERVQHLLTGKKPMIRINNFAALTVPFAVIILSICFVHANYARAEFILGTSVNFGPVVNSEFDENQPVMSADGLTLYFASNRPGGAGDADIWTSTRSSLEAEWNTPTNFTAINTTVGEHTPFVSSDHLTFLYKGNSADKSSTIFGLYRNSTDDPWGPPVALPLPINDGLSSHQSAPYMSSDGLTLLLSSDRTGGEGSYDIWEASRTSLSDPWTAINLGPEINTSFVENTPAMSSDGLTLLLRSTRPGGEGLNDIWMSTREFISADWGPMSNLGPIINTAGQGVPSQFWDPENLLLFNSSGLPGEGASDLFYVTIVPEPSTGAMSICGVLLLAGFVRMRLQRCR